MVGRVGKKQTRTRSGAMLFLGHNLFLKVLQIRGCLGSWHGGDVSKDDFGI